MKNMNSENRNTRLSLSSKIYILRGIISIVLAGTLFFLGAGSLAIPRGWFSFSLALVVVTISNLVVAHHNPGLLDQRSRIRKGSKSWDKLWLFSIMLLLIYGLPLLAGYDIGRLGHQVQGISFYLGLLLYLLSVSLVTWAMSVNQFFETSVRIQDERGHYVINTGPYRFVRHPGYSAMIFYVTGFPLMVGSFLALYFGLLMYCGVILRTLLEDNTLKNELKGYREYAHSVRYRLIPYIW